MFARLSHELDSIARLEKAWERCVPAPLGLHTRPLSYRSGRLLVQATSSLWASRLRHQRERVIAALQQEPALEGLAALQIRIAPAAQAADTEGETKRSKPTAGLSAATAALIADVAEAIEDPDLKAALRRLGMRADKRR